MVKDATVTVDPPECQAACKSDSNSRYGRLSRNFAPNFLLHEGNSQIPGRIEANLGLSCKSEAKSMAPTGWA